MIAHVVHGTHMHRSIEHKPLSLGARLQGDGFLHFVRAPEGVTHFHSLDAPGVSRVIFRQHLLLISSPFWPATLAVARIRVGPTYKVARRVPCPGISRGEALVIFRCYRCFSFQPNHILNALLKEALHLHYSLVRVHLLKKARIIFCSSGCATESRSIRGLVTLTPVIRVRVGFVNRRALIRNFFIVACSCLVAVW